MNIFLISTSVLGLLVVWYTLYNWIYLTIEKKITKINTLGNIVIFVFTPLMAYCMIITILVVKFIYFLEKESR